MTSNLGSQFLVDPLLEPEAKRDAVMAAVRWAFKPEFLNRLDEVVLDPLSRDESSRTSCTFRCGPWDPATGPPDHPRGHRRAPRPGSPSRASTRPTVLARCAGLVQREIGDRLKHALLAGSVRDGDTVTVDRGEDGLTLR